MKISNDIFMTELKKQLKKQLRSKVRAIGHGRVDIFDKFQNGTCSRSYLVEKIVEEVAEYVKGLVW